MRYYVGNVPSDLDGEGLKELVESLDLHCEKAIVIMDTDTGLSRNFGFIEVPHTEKEVLDILNGYMISNRKLRVSVARPLEPKQKERVTK